MRRWALLALVVFSACGSEEPPAGSDASTIREDARPGADRAVGDAEVLDAEPALDADLPGDDGGSPDGGTPPGDASVVTPGAPGVVTSFVDSIAFLFEPGGRQVGVAPGAIDPGRAAVVHGRVLERSGAPVEGAVVTVLGAAELGHTETQADGSYDLVVNGGGQLVVDIVKSGFLPVQRHLDTPWSDWIHAPDVVLIALDGAATMVTLGAAAPAQTAQGSMVMDGDGMRRASLIFPAGVGAELLMPDGSTMPFTGGTVRATEYTVGESGPRAMPAALPPATGYTYAVELSFDEALAAGARSVRFDAPVTLLVDNFLDLPVGTGVPVGAYDRSRAEWLPEPDGRVIGVLGVTAGLALLDLDGDGVEDGGAALAALGIEDDERRAIATLQPQSGSLWRSRLTHFTPIDCNYPYWPPGGAFGPPYWNPFRRKPGKQPCGLFGSSIGCEAQTLGENVGVAGTDYQLVYQSERTPGRRAENVARIALSGTELPPDGLLRIDLEASIAGQRIARTYAPAPNLTHEHVWDGLDLYGRTVHGPRTLSGVVSFVFEARMAPPGTQEGASFAEQPAPGTFIGETREGREIPFHRPFAIELGTQGPDARELGLGGWTLDVHHLLDPTTGRVFLGSGGSLEFPLTVHHFAGAPGARESDPGLPRADAVLDVAPRSVQVGPDGTVYYQVERTGEVRAIGADGRVRIEVGADPAADCSVRPPADGARAGCFSNSGTVRRVDRFTVGFDGRLVFSYLNNGGLSIWRVEPDGTTQRLAGVWNMGSAGSSPLPEGGVARDTPLYTLGTELAVAADGALLFSNTYVLPSFEGRTTIYRVGPGGRLAVYGGARTEACDRTFGGPARSYCLDNVRSLAADRVGNLFVRRQSEIVRLGPDGLVAAYAGENDAAGCAISTVRLARGEVCVSAMGDMQVGPDDVLYGLGRSADRRTIVLRLDDFVEPVFGGGESDTLGGPALGYGGRTPPGSGGFAVKPDHGLIVLDATDGDNQLLETRRGAKLVGGSLFVPALGGRAGYLFDRSGRHLETRDVLTGARSHAFEYTPQGALAAVTDRDGQVTRIERDGSGRPVAIVAPGGERTALTLDGDGWITRVENPAGEHSDMTYGAGGLLATFSDKRQNVASFTFDGHGNLIREDNRLGGVITLEKTETEDSQTVTVTTDGVPTVFLQTLRDGVRTHAITDASQAVTVVADLPDGTRLVTGTDQTSTVMRYDTDPRFAVEYPSSVTVVRDGQMFERTERRTLIGGTGIFDAAIWRQEVTAGGQTTVAELDGGARTLTVTTPAGRTRGVSYDPAGRITSVARGAGLAPVRFGWGMDGLLASYTAGSYAETYEHDASRRPSAVIDPLRRVELTYDGDGRLATLSDPDGAVAWMWNADSTLAGFTLPGNAAHALTSNAHGDYTSYTPPGATAAYQRTYDARGFLERITLPSGRTQVLQRDPLDRLSAIVTPEATLSFAWIDGADLPSEVTRTPGMGPAQTTRFTWSNGLPSRTETVGAVASTSVLEHNTLHRPARQTFTSGNDALEHVFAYDADQRLTQYGPLQGTHGGPDGALSELAIGTARIRYGYDQEGHLTSRTVSVGGADRYTLAVTYAPSGLPSTRTEQGTVFAYQHDHAGRLTSVTRDGAPVESYGYDARGNRTTSGAENATYDLQDRLLTRAGVSYTFDADGFLITRGADGFVYSATGELLRAGAVSYAYDAFRRVVRRSEGGAHTELHYADPFLFFRPSAYRAPGEALTALYYDDHGHLVALARGNTRWIVASDQVGTPRLVIAEATGAVVKELVYDSFGRRTSDTNPAFVLPIGFAGGIEDGTTGLVRFGFRDYEPASGRWTARDPIFLSGGQLNLYAYVGSSPVRFRDPLGLFCVGGSGYAGLGGGGKACFDDKGFSVCAEVGAGIGNGVDIAPDGRIDNNFFGFEAAGKGGVGPLSFGCEGSYGVDTDKLGTRSPCSLVTDGDCKIGAFGAEKSLLKDSSNDQLGAFDILKNLGLPYPGQEPGKKSVLDFQVKGTVKGCQNLTWGLF